MGRIQKDVLSELRDEMQRMNNREGMHQYLLLINAEDVIFSKDLMIINLLNSEYHGLDPFDYNEAVTLTIETLKAGVYSNMLNIEIEDGLIVFKPLTINKFNTTNEFFLLCKKESGFLLKDVFEYYFKDVDILKLIDNIFINPNSSGLLSSDSNFVVYDDSDRISFEVLNEFSRMFHKNKLIAKSKVEDFIMENILERETRIDFITDNISHIMDELFVNVVGKLKTLVAKGEITEREAIRCFKTNSIIGGVNMVNIERLNKISPDKRPGYSIGLTALFSTRV